MNRISGDRTPAKPHNNINDGVGAGEENQKTQHLADMLDSTSDEISLSGQVNGDILTTELKLTSEIIQE